MQVTFLRLGYMANIGLFLLDNKVILLRAKARADRWEEEKMLIRYEMRWVVNCFEYKKSMLEKWADESEKTKLIGHQIYAWKQVALWDNFINKAENSFKK